jgi:hypothetical protein
VSIEPLRESLDAAPRSWAAPARPLLPLAVFCAADLGENGALCDHLLAACPDRPVCDAEHPFDPSTRCLRRDCDGQHDPFGLPAWSADIPTEEDPMSTTELAETEQAMQDAIARSATPAPQAARPPPPPALQPHCPPTYVLFFILFFFNIEINPPPPQRPPPPPHPLPPPPPPP